MLSLHHTETLQKTISRTKTITSITWDINSISLLMGTKKQTETE